MDAAIFTAMDAALFDVRTFSAGTNRRAIERLRAAGVPLIPIAVMTLEELAPIARQLGLQHAMIIEAGGAIARWSKGQWIVEPCGPPAEILLDVIREIEDRSGANLFLYSLSPDRFFSAPFVVEKGNIQDVIAIAESLGFFVRRGGRFFHLCRPCDAGKAFMRVRDELQCDTAIAIGGSLAAVRCE